MQETILGKRGAYVAEEIAGIDDNVVVSINFCLFISTISEQCRRKSAARWTALSSFFCRMFGGSSKKSNQSFFFAIGVVGVNGF